MFKGAIARSTIRTSLVLGLRLVVQAGTLLLVARMLGPEQYGAFAGIAALAVLMGTFATFGTHLVLLAEVAKDPSKRQSILAYAVPTTLISGCALFLLYLAAGIFGFSHTSVSLVVIACIGLTETLILPFYSLPAIEELALENTARSQLLFIFPLVLRMTVASLIILFQPRQPLVVFAFLYLATALLAIVVIKIYKPQAWLGVKHWKLPTKQNLKHSAGYAVLSLTSLGPSEFDKILAIKLLPLDVSGLYAAASRVIGAATLPVTALLLSAMPRLFRYGTKNPEKTNRLNHWIFASVFIYGLLLGGLLWLAAPLIQHMFGNAYMGMTQILQWLCISVPALALRISAANVLMTMGSPWQRATFEVIGMISLTLTSIILYPRLGIIGIAVALGFSEWLMAMMGVFIVLTRKSNT